MNLDKEYYEIKTSFCNYYVEIWHQYHNIDKVYIGGKKKCVVFSIYLDDPNEVPNLDGFGFDENCNTSGNLQRTHGTQHLLKTALTFVKTLYKASSILLKDTSTIECNGYNMSLMKYSILHYGKTWYEKHFLARPHNTVAHDLYNKSIQDLKHI